MALEKIDILALGRGNLTDNSNAAIVFSANNIVSTWDNSISYDQYNVVEYSGRVYRSKVALNVGNQPDISPSQWETMYVGVKDGDVAMVIDGASSTILQRAGGLWRDLAGNPATVALVDGQVSPADAFVFLGSDKSFAHVEYTIRRGAGQDRKRKGDYNILNDNSIAVEYDHSYVEIGTDVNVTVTWDISGGNVRMRYTSALETIPIELRYSLKGWN